MKEEFYKGLNNLLIDKGLLKEPDINVWIKDFQSKSQGVVMNINGQRFQQPGEVVKMMYKLEVMGDGSIDEVPFSQINFQVKQGNDFIVDTDECIYYDEIEIFESADIHYKAAFQARNHSMIDRSDLAVFFVTHQKGGAYQALQYAVQQGKDCINLFQKEEDSP